MKHALSIFGLSIVFLSGCAATPDLEYDRTGALNYEKFNVAIEMDYPSTVFPNRTLKKDGTTKIGIVPIRFSDVKFIQNNLKISTEGRAGTGVLDVDEPFVGVSSSLSKLNWSAALFGMGMIDVTDEVSVDTLYCTRIKFNNFSATEVTQNALSKRLICFRDSDNDELMDAAFARPFGRESSTGYLPSGYLRKVKAMFEPFALIKRDGQTEQSELALEISTERDGGKTWLGTDVDDFYRLVGRLKPNPLNTEFGSLSRSMLSYLPKEGTSFSNTVDWLNGAITMDRDSEDDQWTVDVILPDNVAQSDLSLDFDIGR